ncbi:DUF2491 family protein [Azospirillum sp. sgz302134]
MPLRHRIIASLLSALLALAPAAPVPVLSMVAGAAVTVWPDTAEARASSSGGRSSSGGYSRPSRTPSFSTGPSTSRVPSVGGGGFGSGSSSGGYSRPPSSGGYARPQTSPSVGTPSTAPQSGSDLSVSRRSSSEALERYRAQQERERTPPVTAPPPTTAQRPDSGSGWNWGGGGGSWGGSWGTGWGQRRSGGTYPTAGYPGGPYAPGGWYGGWRAPGWASGGSPTFGIWSGIFLWYLLDNLSRPGYADWFHNHQGDPGYGQWRSEAERRAQNDPELRQRLDDLDARLRAQEGKPRDPNYLPPDVPPNVAQAQSSESQSSADSRAAQAPAPQPSSSGGRGFGLVAVLVLLAVGGVVAVIVLRRRSASSGQGASTMNRSPLGTAANIIRNKVTGAKYEPSLFRVGMTITLDPTPFLLAGTATKVTPPSGAGGDTLVSVEAVGKLQDGDVVLHRLYLQGGKGFFQIHLGADGTPDECRWFSQLDEVHPADAEEWDFWLSETEGMIGYPQFQTKDGKLYDRRWTPGTGQVRPITFNETLTDHRGSRTRRLTAMLYSASTGAADPAPETEYVLVAAIEDMGQAWVDVRAGIDVNPASLSLA